MSASVLLVIGIHREEFAFGQAVATSLDHSAIDLLSIPEGLSGRRPRPDERFHHDLLHRALYLQLLAHIQPQHRLLIDLHTGLDPRAPLADLYCRSPEALPNTDHLAPPPRRIALGRPEREPGANTIVPKEIWRNPRFLYVAMEVYLAESGAGRSAEQDYARALLAALAGTTDVK